MSAGLMLVVYHLNLPLHTQERNFIAVMLSDALAAHLKLNLHSDQYFSEHSRIY